KKKWFVGQRIVDVSFLEGITLPDGAEAFDLRWIAHKLTPLTGLQSTQLRIDPDLFDFYRRFFTRWMETDDFDALALAFGAGTSAHTAELAARLRVWRIRDHGRVADLAHEAKPFSAKQRSTLAAIAKERNALVRHAPAADAFFPLEVKGRDAAPLQGFIV